MARDPETVWDDQYYDEMYTDANAYFDDSDANFEKAAVLYEQLQLLTPNDPATEAMRALLRRRLELARR